VALPAAKARNLKKKDPVFPNGVFFMSEHSSGCVESGGPLKKFLNLFGGLV
jgi:hypothetical protein